MTEPISTFEPATAGETTPHVRKRMHDLLINIEDFSSEAYGRIQDLLDCLEDLRDQLDRPPLQSGDDQELLKEEARQLLLGISISLEIAATHLGNAEEDCTPLPLIR